MKSVETIRAQEMSDWERNAAFYPADDHAPLMAGLADRRERYYDLRSDQRVLDLGCGSGATVAKLRARGIDAIGVDYSQAMVEAGVRQYSLGDRVQQADATDLPFEDNTFDVVLANGVFHHLAVQHQLADALREVSRVLKPGGRLCCFDRNGSVLSGVMTWVCIHVKELLRLLTLRKLFPSCASRNEIPFGGRKDLSGIEQEGFTLARRCDVSTFPFFLSVVMLNTIQYFLSERIRRALEKKICRWVMPLETRCNWHWFSVEQFAVFSSSKIRSAASRGLKSVRIRELRQPVQALTDKPPAAHGSSTDSSLYQRRPS